MFCYPKDQFPQALDLDLFLTDHCRAVHSHGLQHQACAQSPAIPCQHSPEQPPVSPRGRVSALVQGCISRAAALWRRHPANKDYHYLCKTRLVPHRDKHEGSRLPMDTRSTRLLSQANWVKTTGRWKKTQMWPRDLTSSVQRAQLAVGNILQGYTRVETSFRICT